MPVTKSRSRRATALRLFLVVLVSAGCADDDDRVVFHSGDIGINLNLGPSDIDINGDLVDGKNITTEIGNPCGKFMQDAQTFLGMAPSTLVVNSVVMEIDPNPQDVTNLDDLWSNEVAVFFVFGGTTLVEVARGTAPAIPGPFSMPITVVQADLDANMSDIVACNYEVRVKGVANPGLSPTFSAGLTTTVNLSAFP